MNRELLAEWAGIAAWFLEEAGFGDGPVDPEELAVCYGLRVLHGGGRACTCRVGDTIFVDRTLKPVQQRADIAHELAHVAMLLAGYPYVHDEAAASAIGAMLLCPERPIREDLRRHAWDLVAILPRYGVSWELLARRVVEVRAAVLTIVDRPPNERERVSTRIWSAWLHTDWTDRPTLFERGVIAEAFDARAHVRARNQITAYYVPGDDGWERVLLVAAAEELEQAIAQERAEVG